ncbi:C-C chemokine receptor type 6 [Brachyhypopomus gauderio]|uniref:C-C chemokine receptor type 6 n=1 Tax=Brachyhypopomus gauderio TaxID=698409 RepID=UPI00404389EB
MDDNDDYDYGSEFDTEPCDLGGNHKQGVTIQTYIYSFICVLGLLGNVLVLVTYAFYKKAKTMTDVYLVNVTFADLLFVVALPLIIYNEQHVWSMGAWACKFLRGIYSINLYSCMLLLACISADRYIAIVKARRSFGMHLKGHIYSRIVCTAVWLLAIGLSTPTFIYNNLNEEEFNGTIENECSFSFESADTAQLMKILVPSLQVVVGFFVPLLVMGFCYCSVILTLLKAKNFERHKAVRVVLAAVLVFILCHLPYNAVVLIHTNKLLKERDCEIEQQVLLALSVTRNLAYLHCCLNPILYAFIGVKFRNHFCKVLEDLWCFGKRYFSSRRSSQQTSELYLPAHKSPSASILENPPSFSM